jgi:carotenoid cleavage dioxygenase-like enzyme
MPARRSGERENASTASSLFGTFGNPLTSDPLAVGNDSGVANTNIVWHGGRLMALEEVHASVRDGSRDPGPRRVMCGPYDLGGKFTAHPKIDPVRPARWCGSPTASDPMPLSAKMSYGGGGRPGRSS